MDVFRGLSSATFRGTFRGPSSAGVIRAHLLVDRHPMLYQCVCLSYMCNYTLRMNGDDHDDDEEEDYDDDEMMIIMMMIKIRIMITMITHANKGSHICRYIYVYSAYVCIEAKRTITIPSQSHGGQLWNTHVIHMSYARSSAAWLPFTYAVQGNQKILPGNLQVINATI